ncbi:hypothetical protein BN1708_019446 [Verticillium longisporum]|uniref:Uncharacterized protein n=1 Tax=Verticillium longisporum TaxID=100787 RepID=A0A0G4MJB5_VERLO|nr:hypothetical protein BN1708_019446 [Verticillium longisporum]
MSRRLARYRHLQTLPLRISRRLTP